MLARVSPGRAEWVVIRPTRAGGDSKVLARSGPPAEAIGGHGAAVRSDLEGPHAPPSRGFDSRGVSDCLHPAKLGVRNMMTATPSCNGRMSSKLHRLLTRRVFYPINLAHKRIFPKHLQ